jgi:putative endonuclease
MYHVYILFSKKLGRFYAGQTMDLQKRLLDHNRSASPFTANGSPWVLITSFDLSSRKATGLYSFLTYLKYEMDLNV